jgi:photosystem II stability/assembly factor-like uncharacterized protein/PKD repeat protein
MLRVLIFCAVTFIAYNSYSQSYPPILSESPDLPQWAQMMYSENPNAFEVRDAYQAYFQEHPFVKTVHTQYYKRWVSAVQPWLDEQGFVQMPDGPGRESMARDILNKRSGNRDGEWTYAGPDIHYNADGTLTPTSEQANVYCHDRSSSNNQILYCGTESGGVYKTTDGGSNWTFLTANTMVNTITAIRIHPTNPDVVYFGSSNDLWRSTDGGQTWSVIGQPSFVALAINAWEIAFNPGDPGIMYLAANQGFFRSTDGGDNWTEILPRECMSIAFQPGNPDVVYTIQYETDLNYSRFYKSTDGGLTFTVFENGWYSPAPGDAGLIGIDGGRLATSEADPNRIYALLVGYQEAGAATTTNGFVGVWVSYDAGETWSLPHGQIGTPYTEEHPNLMNFTGDNGDYSQIFYNTTMVASQLDADKVLIGGLNLWQSDDACATYFAKAGYVGYVPNVHVDMQELRIYKTGPESEEIWLSNDGGIHHSTTFMESHESRCRGIRAVNLWGYDQGWNHDIMVGGRYHNGNMGYYEMYPENEFLALGGGEAPTGYVNYSDERKTYFSDIAGRTLPESIDGLPEYFGMNLSPNESYWFNNSSRIMFDNRYYNVAWLGKQNKLYKSINGGSTFAEHFSFGVNPDHWVLWIEQSYADPNVMVAHQATGNTSKLWRSADGGESWVLMDIPQNYRSLVFTLSGSNAEELWVAYADGNTSNKVFRTTNSGSTWENLSGPELTGTSPWAIAHVFGTDGGVYMASQPGEVFYRNNSMSEWELISDGIPVTAEPLRLVPFYRDNKIRLATWNLGVWEADLIDTPQLLADFAAEYGFFFCPGDPVHFVDHSVCSAAATYEWSFPGAIPSSSIEKFPTVVYQNSGQYEVSLTVTDNGQSATVTKSAYISSSDNVPAPIYEGFEGGAIPENWKFNHPTGGNFNWTVTNGAGGYGESTYALFFDNYWQDVGNSMDEVWTPKLDISNAPAPELRFDVAYAPYGFPYTDTLAVLISPDCGATWDQIYMKGNTDLATAPATGDPFIPNAEQWRTEILDLSAYTDADEIIIAFRNMGSWGNYIYVDNINLDEDATSVPEHQKSTLAVYPNPTANDIRIRYSGNTSSACTVSIRDASGRLIQEYLAINSNELNGLTISLSQLSQGVYTLSVTAREVQFIERIIKR